MAKRRKFTYPPGSTDGFIERLEGKIASLQEYACHKWSCARIGNAALKCDCGLTELLGENYVEEIPNTGPIVPKLGR